MWLDETVSPATSTSGTTRVSNSSCERRKLGGALRALAEAEVLADRHVLGAEPADQHVLDELLGALLGEPAVERDHHQLLDAEPGDQVALDRERVEQLGRRLRVDHRQRVRVEGQHRVAAADHLAVAEVHAVEGADRDAARAASPARRRGAEVTFMRARTLRRAGARHRAARRSRAARRRARQPHGARLAGAAPRHAPRRGAPRAASALVERALRQERERLAERHDPLGVGVLQPERADRRALELARSRRRRGRRSACARRCPPSTRSRTPARSPSCQSSSAR